MELRKPKRVKGEIKQIVIPRGLNNLISLLPHQISEGMGFVYGVKEGDSIYLGTFSHKHDLWKKNINPTSVNLEGEGGKRYIKAHNKICKTGGKTFGNFVQIVYHSHPKLIERDLSEKDKKELHSQHPEFEGDTSRLVRMLDNTWLSKEDEKFIGKYSSKRLALLSVGKEGDVRQGSIKNFPRKFWEMGLRYLLNYEKSRLQGFKINSGGIWDVPLVIAEDSEDHKDEEICSEVVSSMDPLREIFLNYSEEVINRFKETYPEMTRKALSLIKKYSLFKNTLGKRFF